MHYTFQASGSLWQDALVIQDLETKSLWSQISGECIQGPSEGKNLTIFKASHTTFANFKKQYPDGLLLVKPEKGDAGSVYQDYFADSAKMGIFGRVETFEQLAPKAKVFGVKLGNHQSAVSLEYLEANGQALLPIASRTVIVIYDKQSQSVNGFLLLENDTLDPAELVVINSKITTKDGSPGWDRSTGKLLSGSGDDLEQVSVITAFWFAWASFFPNSDLIK